MAPFILATLALCVLFFDLRIKWNNGEKMIFLLSAALAVGAYAILAFTSFGRYPPSPLLPVEEWIRAAFRL